MFCEGANLTIVPGACTADSKESVSRLGCWRRERLGASHCRHVGRKTQPGGLGPLAQAARGACAGSGRRRARGRTESPIAGDPCKGPGRRGQPLGAELVGRAGWFQEDGTLLVPWHTAWPASTVARVGGQTDPNPPRLKKRAATLRGLHSPRDANSEGNAANKVAGSLMGHARKRCRTPGSPREVRCWEKARVAARSAMPAAGRQTQTQTQTAVFGWRRREPADHRLRDGHQAGQRGALAVHAPRRRGPRGPGRRQILVAEAL